MCLAVVCVHGRRLFSNPVTYLIYDPHAYGCWSVTENRSATPPKSVRPILAAKVVRGDHAILAKSDRLGRFWRDMSVASNYNFRATYNLGQQTLA